MFVVKLEDHPFASVENIHKTLVGSALLCIRSREWLFRDFVLEEPASLEQIYNVVARMIAAGPSVDPDAYVMGMNLRNLVLRAQPFLR